MSFGGLGNCPRCWDDLEICTCSQKDIDAYHEKNKKLKCQFTIDTAWELAGRGMWSDDIKERRKLYNYIIKYKNQDIDVYKKYNTDGKYDKRIKMMEDEKLELKKIANI